MFILNDQLHNDSIIVGNFPLCQLLLKNDNHYPWFILVPKRNNISEIFELSADDQQQLWDEISLLSQYIKTAFQADKINVGALGNMVSQLHIHVIARHKDDAVWPKSVWDKLPATPYSAEEQGKIIALLQQHMPPFFVFK